MTDDQDKKNIVAELEARRTREGKEIVEASRFMAASDGAERGYAAWVGLDVGDLSKLTDPEERRLGIEQIAMNTRDLEYRLALEEKWPDLAREAVALARTLPAEEPQIPHVQDAPAEKKVVWGPVEWATHERPEPNPLASPVDAVQVSDATPGKPANEADARNPANEPNGGAQHREDAAAQSRLSDDTRATLLRNRADDRKQAEKVLRNQRATPERKDKPADPEPVRANEPSDADNTIEAEGAGVNPILTKDGYELPPALAARYVVKEGEFWLAQALAKEATPTERAKRAGKETEIKPAFWDTGARLKCRTSDRATIADMVAIAQAKRWTSATVRGTSDFRRNAWLELSLADMEVKGFEPREQDLLMLQALKQEREALRISAAKEKAPVVQRPATTGASLAPAKDLKTSAIAEQTAAMPEFRVADVRAAWEKSIEHHPANVRAELMKRFDAHIRAGIDLQSVGKGPQLRQTSQARFVQQTESWNKRKEDEVKPQGPEVKQSPKPAAPSI